MDDDDWTDDSYLESILKGCKSGVDVVTFILEKIPMHKLSRFDHKFPNKEFWKFGLYKDQRHEGLMCANHLCAWKRSIATMVGWSPYLGYGDDQLWYKPLMAADVARTQYHIDKPLYKYRLNLNQSANQSREKIRFSKEYVGQGLHCFWYGDEIVVQAGSRHYGGNGKICVINSKGQEVKIIATELEHFATVKL